MNDTTYNMLASMNGMAIIAWSISTLVESSGWLYIGALMIGTVIVTVAIRNVMNEEN
jgi:uncharacterized membrane protein YcjF (UPF0283 family)